MCVLSLLSKKDCYGYELVGEISTLIEISEGTIYPLLKRLKDEKYVTTYLRESEEGPPRKYYKLTSEGCIICKKQCDEWNSFIKAVNHLINGSRPDSMGDEV